MGFEPTTPTLARLCSTPELHPRNSIWHQASSDLSRAHQRIQSAVDGGLYERPRKQLQLAWMTFFTLCL